MPLSSCFPRAAHRRRVVLAAWLALATCPELIAASGFQAVESIRAAALSTFAGEGPDAAVAEAHLDPALRMPQCDQALEARRSSAATVEVSCPTGWRLFVPVKVQRSQSVLVLTRNVASGETITADLFMAERRDTARIAGAAIAEPAQAVGRSARRMLAAGSVLTTGDLESPRVVRRGDVPGRRRVRRIPHLARPCRAGLHHRGSLTGGPRPPEPTRRVFSPGRRGSPRSGSASGRPG